MCRRDMWYLTGFALSAAFLSYPLALRFEPSSFFQQLISAVAFLMCSAFLSFAYRFYGPDCAKNALCIAGGILSIFAASLVFSLVRGSVVLFVFVSLFALPGSIVGLLIEKN